MKFAAVVSVQSNKKKKNPVELFLIGLHSCGFLYANMHPAGQKTDFSLYHSPPKTSFQLQIPLFLSLSINSLSLAAVPVPELHPEKNRKMEPALFSDWNCTPGNGCFVFLCGKRFYSPAMELSYEKGPLSKMFGMVITGLSPCGCNENVTICGFWQGVNVGKIWP